MSRQISQIKTVLFLICFKIGPILIPNITLSQYHFSLSYEEFDVFFSPKKCVDTIDFTLSGKYSGYKLKMYLKDCKGEAYFELFDKKNELRMTGNYDNAIDTLKKYKLARYLGETNDIEKYRISAIKYLYPLKAREWTYYEDRKNRKKSRTIIYVYTTE